MNSDRSYRAFAGVLALATCAGVLAQPTVSFQALDVDASGSLSRGEFSQLPFSAGSPELFVDLDTNHDLAVSRAEWTAGSPDERGIPLGPRSAAVRQGGAAGATGVARPASTQHGPNVPREREAGNPLNEPPPLESGRLSGNSGAKRGMSATAPRPSAFPIPGDAGPPK